MTQTVVSTKACERGTANMSDPIEHTSEVAKNVVDAVSLATVIGTLSNMLPSIAALFSIIWSIIRIYESKTIQGWIKEDNNAE